MASTRNPRDVVSSARPAGNVESARIRSRVEAEAYVASVCFKHGPPRLAGVELEWTVHHHDDPTRPVRAEHLALALGPHAPPSLVPDSPHVPLAARSVVTVEPGGQVEISTAPRTAASDLIAATSADIDQLRRLLAAVGLELGSQGTDPHRPVRRLLRTPRYAAMETNFNRRGPAGLTMMCSTAGLQVCLDAGEGGQVAARWAAVHALGPVFLAAFANSPTLSGIRSGWASTRMLTLYNTDPPRTRPGGPSADPGAAWARRALETPVLCVREREEPWPTPIGVTFGDWIDGALHRRPTFEDLDYHLTMLFTPVRPRGYLEIRYLDIQPDEDWVVPAALVLALFARDRTVDRLLELTEPARGRWLTAACQGLHDPVLARTATSVLTLALQGLRDLGLPPPVLDHVVRRTDQLVHTRVPRVLGA